MDLLQTSRSSKAIEIAAVVIVLGAVFVMTLKGAVAIDMMKAIATAQQFRDFQNRVQNYLFEFRQLPGDDPAAAQRWERLTAVTMVDGFEASLEGNGFIDGALSDVLNPDGEPYVAWRDLRLSGLLDGNPTLIGQAAQPDDYFGGVFGFAESNFGLEQVICATRVPGRAAEYIDKQLDDGNVATGLMRGTSQWDPK